MSHWPYLPFLLVWALPVVALQWIVGGEYLWRERGRWPWVVLGLGAYFSIADGIAIHAGVWRFDDRALIGLWLGPVPIEEVAFYLLTVAMVAQGFVIAWAVLDDPQAALARWRAAFGRLRRRGGDRYQTGVWAVPLALAPGFALAGLLGVPTPLEPLTEGVMQLTPVGLANVLLGALGGFARTAALLGAIAITLPIGGLLGLCVSDPSEDGDKEPSRESPRWIAWAPTATLSLWLAIALAAATPYSAERVAALVCGLAFAPALWVAQRLRSRFEPLPRPAADVAALKVSTPALASEVAGAAPNEAVLDPDSTPPLRSRGREVGPSSHSRRSFLRGAIGSGLTVAACLGLGAYDVWAGSLGSLLGRGEVIRSLFAFVAPKPRAAGFPVIGMEPEVTPVAHFYLLSKNDVDPTIQPSDWYLRVSGAVDHPFALTYAQLTGLPRTDEYVTLRCVNNPPGGHLMSTAFWSGVPLASLLARAGLHANAVAVVLRAPDGYDEIIPLDAATSANALLAYGMNGETLPRRHGGPVRALVPGYFGFKNVKWVQAIEVVTAVEPGYWARRGWTATQVHSVARIDTWQRTASGVVIGGVAFGGARGVSKVEVRADGGPWTAAELNVPALSAMSWVQWRAEMAMTTGAHEESARMADGTGAPQIETASNPQPGGATGLDSVRIAL